MSDKEIDETVKRLESEALFTGEAAAKSPEKFNPAPEMESFQERHFWLVLAALVTFSLLMVQPGSNSEDYNLCGPGPTAHEC